LSALSSNRRVEVGMLHQHTLGSVALCFESFPVWMLSISPSSCSHLWIPGVESAESLLQHVKQRGFSIHLLQHLLKKWDTSSGTYGDFSPPSVLTLISGSLQFLQHRLTKLATDNTAAIGVLDHHFHGRLRGGRPTGCLTSLIQWHRVRHTSVGGATDYCALFGCVGLHIDPHTTTL
jgi:hypothetical protein